MVTECTDSKWSQSARTVIGTSVLTRGRHPVGYKREAAAAARSVARPAAAKAAAPARHLVGPPTLPGRNGGTHPRRPRPGAPVQAHVPTAPSLGPARRMDRTWGTP